jgi:hypothetical protein
MGRRRKDSQRLGVGLANLLSSVLLVVTEEFGPESDISRLVNTVNVSETSGNGEVGGDGVQSSVDIVDVWGLGVEGCVVGVGVVDTVLLTSGDTDLHLEPFWLLAFVVDKGKSGLTLHLGHSLEVLDTVGDIVLLGLLGKVEHVGAGCQLGL